MAKQNSYYKLIELATMKDKKGIRKKWVFSQRVESTYVCILICRRANVIIHLLQQPYLFHSNIKSAEFHLGKHNHNSIVEKVALIGIID